MAHRRAFSSGSGVYHTKWQANAQVMVDCGVMVAHARRLFDPNAGPGRTLARHPLAVSGAAVWLAALLLYTLTAAPGIVELFDDSLEFQYVAPAFGIAHPTGYPLYTLAGGIWSRLLFPFGNWAWRMNLFSALAGAAAVALVYVSAARLAATKPARPDLWAGLVAACAFGLGPVWRSQTAVAEVYALHGLFLAALVWAIADLDRRLDEGRAYVGRITLICLLVGLGLAHHRMTALALPALAVYLLWRIPGLWRPRREWLVWATALLLPLALYAYIPLRAAMGVRDLNGAYVNTLPGFLDHVLARQYAAFFAQNPLGAPFSAMDAGRLVWQETGGAAFALGVIGLTQLWDRRRGAVRTWVFVLLLLLANAAFAISYQVADREVFFIPVFLAFALFVGGGAGMVRRLPLKRPLLTVLIQAGLTLLVAAGVPGRAPAENRRDDWTAHHHALLMASAPFPPGSRVIGLEGEMTALRFMQDAEELGRNAQPITADDPAQRAALLAENVAHGYPTFITRELPGSEQAYSFSGAGALVRVWPRGQAEVEKPAMPLDVELLDGRVRLEGYELRVVELPGGPVLELTLGWLPSAPLSETLKVSLRLVDAEGTPLTDAAGRPIAEDRFPIRQAALSRDWLPGELVRDVHYLPMPPEAGMAAILQVIVYDADTVVEEGRVELPLPAR